MSAPYYIYGGTSSNDAMPNLEKHTSVVNTAYGTRRYFSSIDTDVYFGKKLIDEMVAFDFIIEEKKIPIFGYNNFVPKRILTGQKVIQGSFAINFTKTFDLARLLESDEVGESIYANDYEETMFYCADDNKAIFGKGFDITLCYGDAWEEGSYNSCTQTLVGCYITSYRQAFDTSGEPILDMYTFIAKDLARLDDGGTVTEPEKDKETDNVTNPANPPANPSIAPENRHMSNELDPEDKGSADKAYAESNTTLCVEIRPMYVYVDGTSKLTIRVDVVNEGVTVKIDSLSVNFNDEAVPSLSGSTYNLKKDQSDNNFSFSFNAGTMIKVGQDLKKYFDGKENMSLSCNVKMNCTATGLGEGDEDLPYDFNKETYFYDEKIETGGYDIHTPNTSKNVTNPANPPTSNDIDAVSGAAPKV